MQELEELIKNQKEAIEKRAKREVKRDKEKINFIKNVFYKNQDIIKRYMEEKGISLEEGFDELEKILSSIHTDLYLEKGGKSFQLKEVNELLSVKLGWYERLDKRKLSPEMYVQQCALTLTKKGTGILKKYMKFHGPYNNH